MILISFLILICISNILNDELADYFDHLSTDFFESIDKTAYNINTETIQYSLTYEKSILKVQIKTEEKIKQKIDFVAFLRSENSTKEHKLKCSYPYDDLIECRTKKGLKLDVNDRYHIYYNRSKKEKLIFDYEDIMEDDKKISLIFNPELYVNQTVYLDNKKIMAQINKKCVAGGYLYLVNKRKGLQNFPKDGFNKYIELNNFVYQPDYSYKNLFYIYKEAIRRGYHIIETQIILTDDKTSIVYPGRNSIPTYTNDLIKFSDLLSLCKNSGIILEIKFNYLALEENKINDFLIKILEEIEQNGMINSIIFNDNLDLKYISSLKNFRTDMAISISNISKSEEIDQIKSTLELFKRVVLIIDPKINEESLKYVKSLGYKLKFPYADSKEFSDKLLLYGINFIGTKYLEPFLIYNEKEYPMRVQCVPIFLDDLSECKMYDEHILRDNEFYNIHYSLNIYNKSMDINETAIGEFRYEDTRINDMRYYTLKKMNFEKGLIELITSDKIPKGQIIRGKIGPDHDDVADCYVYDFVCEGIGQNYINCKIDKNSDKVEYNGNYVFYKFGNYSYNDEEITDWNLMKLRYKHIYSNEEKIFYSILVMIISFVSFFSFYSYQSKNSIAI